MNSKLTCSSALPLAAADYRGMLQQREEEMAARKAAAAAKLRMNYTAENKKRQEHGVEVRQPQAGTH
jgi:hypothetical protein